jgi:hypothetical protein
LIGFEHRVTLAFTRALGGGRDLGSLSNRDVHEDEAAFADA